MSYDIDNKIPAAMTGFYFSTHFIFIQGNVYRY